MTSKWRRCDVVTSHRRHYDVMFLLGIWPPLGPPPNILNLGPPQYSKPSYAYDFFSSRNYLKFYFLVIIIISPLWYELQTDVVFSTLTRGPKIYWDAYFTERTLRNVARHAKYQGIINTLKKAYSIILTSLQLYEFDNYMYFCITLSFKCETWHQNLLFRGISTYGFLFSFFAKNNAFGFFFFLYFVSK